MAEDLQEEGPADGIKSFCDVNLEEQAASFLSVQRLAGEMDGAEIIMDGPSLDERALARVNQIVQYKSKAACEALGDQLSKAMHQANRTKVMLFVLAMEVLGGLIRWADSQSFLSLGCSAVRSRVFIYADDVVMFIAPRQDDIVAIKTILQIFSDASSLYTNLDKCVVTLIGCSQEDLQLVADMLACMIGAFPCKYLGIPLFTHNLRRSDEHFIIDCVAARIPLLIGKLLNTMGRAVLVQSTLLAIPVHLSIAVCLSPWAIDRIDKLRRAFIWSGFDSVGAGKCRVAWEIMCRPKELGGLGIIDLRRFGLALRLRWDWVWKSDRSRMWIDLPSSSERVTQALFQAATMSVIGDGNSMLFWQDSWLQGCCIAQIAPAILAAVLRSRAKTRAVASALANRSWVADITGAIIVQVLLEYLNLWDRLLEVRLLRGVLNSLVWHWSSDNKYSAASAYGAISSNRLSRLEPG